MEITGTRLCANQHVLNSDGLNRNALTFPLIASKISKNRRLLYAFLVFIDKKDYQLAESVKHGQREIAFKVYEYMGHFEISTTV